MIELREVSASYSGVDVLKSVSMRLDGRDLILGPNGSGKTTLFRTILGLNVTHKGRIMIDGRGLAEIEGERGLVATNLEEVYRLLRVPLRDLSRLYLHLLGGDYDRFIELSKEFGLKGSLKKKLDQLSAGQRKMACNLMALSTEAKYVLLDEPFESVDPARRARLVRLLQEREGIIMNSHATWLLRNFEDWRAHLMIGGRVYGPVQVKELMKSTLVEGKAGGLSFEIEDKVFSIVPEGTGIKLSELDSLDRLYEVMMYAH